MPAGAERIVAALVAARDRLPALRALFLGDVTRDQCEVSWLNQERIRGRCSRRLPRGRCASSGCAGPLI